MIVDLVIEMVTLNRDVYVGLRPLIDFGYFNYPNDDLNINIIESVNNYYKQFLYNASLIDDTIKTINVDAEMLKNIRPIVNFALMNIHDSELTEQMLNDASMFNSYFVTCSELF